MNDTSLGQLKRVDLREAWTAEDRHFTPWLAHSENLSVLGDTLGLELETVAEEKNVGPFRADILCREVGSDSWVLIENQLERKDHIHLVQLLTYAAGLEAVIVIWVAASFTDEHRAALDWLNTVTGEKVRFFGLEIELWRIGASLPAPKFNIVSQPNDWSRKVVWTTSGDELSETRVKQSEYWDAFHKVLGTADGPIVVSGDRKPQPRSWMPYGVGRTGFRLGAVMVRPRNRVQAELYIYGTDAKAFFGLLQDQRDDIEQDFGCSLEWQELPEKRDCRIAHVLNDVDPFDEADWPRQHEWLAEQLNTMHRVFSDRVRNLDLADWRDDEDE